MRSIQLFASACLAVLIGSVSSCSSEDNPVAPVKIAGYSPEGTTVFSLEPVKKEAGADSMHFVSMTREGLGYNGKFKWEPGDHLYVGLDATTWLGDFYNDIPEGGSEWASFSYEGTFSNPSYPIVYNNALRPGYESDKGQFYIPEHQSGNPVSGTHYLKNLPLFGYAMATKDEANPGVYKANKLQYHGTILALAPFVREKEQLLDYNPKLEKITIYRITDNNEGVLSGSSQYRGGEITPIGNGSSRVSLTVPSLPLTTDEGFYTRPIFYAVIQPGNHSLFVEYELSLSDGRTVIVSRNLQDKQSMYYQSNRIYDVRAALEMHQPQVLTEYNYSRWGAELPIWSQINDNAEGIIYPMVAKARETVNLGTEAVTTYGDGNLGNLVGSLREGQDNPTGQNEGLWDHVVQYKEMQNFFWAHDNGLPIYYDETAQYEYLGALYKVGYWFPRVSEMSQLPGYYDVYFRRKPYPNMTQKKALQGVPADKSKYFFVPCLGKSIGTTIDEIGMQGYYWLGGKVDNEIHFVKLAGVHADKGTISILKRSDFPHSKPAEVAFPRLYRTH